MKRQTVVFLIADVLLISIAVWIAFLLRFDANIPAQYLEEGILQTMIFLALVFCLPIFYFFELYSFSWSYVSTNELISLLKATTISVVLIGFSIFVLKSFQGFPRSTLFISYFLILIFTGGIRFSKRIYLNLFKDKKREKEKERVLIVGAGDAGEQILRSILASSDTSYLPSAFVDDSIKKQGVMIHGFRVLGKIDDIPRIVKAKEIEQMIIALPSAQPLIIKKAVEKGRRAGLQKIKVLPSLCEIVDGKVSLPDLRDFRAEDLLDRKPSLYNPLSVEKLINGKTILVTGAAGSIGSELSRQIAKFNPASLLLLDQDETGIFNISEELKGKFQNLSIVSVIADIQDKRRINYIFDKFRPNLVFHSAAYKHVPLMEAQSDEAVKNNIFGTKTVSEAALRHKAEKFINISTDKAVNPSSVMGATKRVGEMICQSLNQRNSTKFISVRFGNVLGSRGSVIPIFKDQIEKGGPVEITDPKMKRYFMIIPEAVSLVLEAGEMGKGGEVFILNMGNPIRILDLARELIRFSGLEPDKDIPIIFTNPRPGEKFFEEILTAEEGTVATENKNIFMAKLSDVDENKLNYSVEELKGAVEASDSNRIKDILKIVIFSYTPFQRS